MNVAHCSECSEYFHTCWKWLNSFPPGFYNEIKKSILELPKGILGRFTNEYPADGKTWIFACFADISILQGSYALKNFTQLWGGGGGVWLSGSLNYRKLKKILSSNSQTSKLP